MAWRLLRNLARLVLDLVTAPLASRVPRDWIVLRLDRGLIDVPLRPSLPALVPTPRSLSEILDCLERARGDRRVGLLGVVDLVGVVAGLRGEAERVVAAGETTGAVAGSVAEVTIGI